MVRKLTMLFVCLFVYFGAVMAQTQVMGTVVSQEDGAPVVGASVQIVGTKTGTATNVDGRFSLLVPQGATKLRVSYLGMVSKEVAVAPNLKIVLKPDNQSLNEVVVTALGIKRSEKAIGYSATTVSSDKLTAVRSADVVSSISGQVAGVQVNAAAGDPGASQCVVLLLYRVLTSHCSWLMAFLWTTALLQVRMDLTQDTISVMVPVP